MDKKVTDVHVVKIAKFLPKWKIVVSQLGLEDEQIKDIEDRYRNGEEQRSEALKKWIGKKGDQATYRKIYDALIELEEGDAAGKIMALLPQKMTASQNDYSSRSVLYTDYSSTQTTGSILETACNEKIILDIALLSFDWRSVGRRLIGDSKVNDIGREEHDEQSRREKILLKWLQQEGSKATYRRLVEVLETTGNKATAEKVTKRVTEGGGVSTLPQDYSNGTTPPKKENPAAQSVASDVPSQPLPSKKNDSNGSTPQRSENLGARKGVPNRKSSPPSMTENDFNENTPSKSEHPGVEHVDSADQTTTSASSNTSVGGEDQTSPPPSPPKSEKPGVQHVASGKSASSQPPPPKQKNDSNGSTPQRNENLGATNQTTTSTFSNTSVNDEDVPSQPPPSKQKNDSNESTPLKNKNLGTCEGVPNQTSPPPVTENHLNRSTPPKSEHPGVQHVDSAEHQMGIETVRRPVKGQTSNTAKNVFTRFYDKLESVNPDDISAKLLENEVITHREKTEVDNQMHSQPVRTVKLLEAVARAICIDEKKFGTFLDILGEVGKYQTLADEMRVAWADGRIPDSKKTGQQTELQTSQQDEQQNSQQASKEASEHSPGGDASPSTTGDNQKATEANNQQQDQNINNEQMNQQGILNLPRSHPIITTALIIGGIAVSVAILFPDKARNVVETIYAAVKGAILKIVK